MRCCPVFSYVFLVLFLASMEALEGCRLGAGPLKAVVPHHREPDSKTFQMVGAEFFQESSDNTLSVLAHGSRGREDGDNPD